MKQLFIILTLLSATLVKSQDTIDTTTAGQGVLKIYLKCDVCDISFMKQELPYLNYVRDRKLAQVQIIVSTLPTGAGGDQYTLQFLGLKEFAEMEDTLSFIMLPNSSDDDIRRRMNQYILLGLTRYIAKTPYAQEWMVNYEGETNNQETKDKWNYWVFNLSANGWFNGEKYYKNSYVYGSVSARRITNERKIEFYLSNSFSQNNYYIDDSTEIVSLFKSFYTDASYIHSISDHWSAGIESEMMSSIFSNLKFNTVNSALLEYNIFPYSESTRKQFRFYYKIASRYDNYFDTTILNKTKAHWFIEEGGIYISLIKEWGNFETWLSYSNFLNNFTFWGATLDCQASFNLFKGFSLNVSGNVSLIQNQVMLRLNEASDSDILLRQVQLPTSFRYFTSLGISYTFGSIYSNIVNPRLD